MARAKYEKADSTVEATIIKLLTKYTERFSHIRPDQFILVFKNTDKESSPATVRLNPGFLRVVTDKPATLEIWKQAWEGFSENQRAYVLYREFCRIELSEQGGDLKLVAPDVKDFRECIDKFGLDGDKLEDIIA